MNAEFEHIDDLIAKILAGEANHDEKHDFEAWLASSEENLSYFTDIEKIYSRVGTGSDVPDFDADKAWNTVSTRLQQKTKVKSLLPSMKSIRVWRFAAAAVFLIGVGVLIFLRPKNEELQFALTSTDSVIHDTLPDGSFASLNKNSSIVFETDQKKHQRIAKLKGEAFFQVVHDSAQTFVVETQDVFIRDVGTAFNVKSNEKSDSIVVFVKEGEVVFYSQKNTGIELVAGEEGIYVKSTKSFSKSRPEDANESSYADREFRFNNAPISKVLSRLNNVYYQQIKLENSALEDCRITVQFENDDIETIAAIIAETMGWNVSKINNVYTLMGDRCPE